MDSRTVSAWSSRVCPTATLAPPHSRDDGLQLCVSPLPRNGLDRLPFSFPERPFSDQAVSRRTADPTARRVARQTSRPPGTPLLSTRAQREPRPTSDPCVSAKADIICNRATESGPPDTATTTRSPGNKRPSCLTCFKSLCSKAVRARIIATDGDCRTARFMRQTRVESAGRPGRYVRQAARNRQTVHRLECIVRIELQ